MSSADTESLLTHYEARQEEQDTEATFWSRGNMSAASGEGSIWREMEIGRNMARNTAICSSAGCVRQNGDARGE